MVSAAIDSERNQPCRFDFDTEVYTEPGKGVKLIENHIFWKISHQDERKCAINV